MAKLSGQEEGDANRILQQHIYKTYKNRAFKEEWRNLPEIPTSNEISPPSQHVSDIGDERSKRDDHWNDYQNEPIFNPNLPHNIVDRSWPSKAEYIGAHYQILREDAIAPLRRAVAEVRNDPTMLDDGETCIYTHVTFKGLQISRTGVAVQVEFSHERAGKQIRWEQSKRLLQGTLVALSPSSDMFRTKCKVAIVASRSLKLLSQNPPAVQLKWGDSDEAVIDPVEQYVMVEARKGYFEASRHMLVAMQKLMTEKFELENHIVHLDKDLKAPKYIEEQPYMDLLSLAPKGDATIVNDADTDPLINVDILRPFPKNINSTMDKSQLAACQTMLTSRVAIIHGPPGTGKTFVSVATLRIMIENLGPDDPPIIVAAQTNHALDQLLNHIHKFELNIVRLGSRCDKANEAILKRTLYELRQSNPQFPDGNKGLKAAEGDYKKNMNDIRTSVESLITDSLLTAETLSKYKLITDSQLESLHGDQGWEGDDDLNGGIEQWLTRNQMMPIPETPPINLGLPVEEIDIEYEQIEELEEAKVTADGEKPQDDALHGTWMPFNRKFTGRHSVPSICNDKKIKSLLESRNNLYTIPVAMRGEVYRFLEKEMNLIALGNFRTRLRQFEQHVNSYLVTKALCNVRLMRHLGTKVIGCTTTGLAKYRGLLSALKPRTLLIEEAAETLEGKVIGGLMASVEHLILVGDHQQLQAGCTIRALETAPYHMRISMFERLVNNGIKYVMLNKQRRMIPDVRKLLCIGPNPFYRGLQDHHSVLDRVNNRPPVPGMGGLDTYFFHHEWPEASSPDCSRYNLIEAQMIARFFFYLCLNGVDPAKITVLTFYNRQKKVVIKELRSAEGLNAVRHFNVSTVDSYQGEENEIILLSVVRSNTHLGIGFLDNKNRLIVALSRARRGLYIFGNSITLSSAETNDDVIDREPLWFPLMKFMRAQGRYDLDGGLPLTCSKHNKVTCIFEPTQFNKVFAGGCDEKCEGGLLPCGHPCTDNCHPYKHSRLQCRMVCPRTLSCGHKCSRLCRDGCFCDVCYLHDGQVSAEDCSSKNVELFDDLGDVSAVLRDSPTKSIIKRSGSQQPIERRVAFSQAAKGKFATSVVTFGGSQIILSAMSKESGPSKFLHGSLGPVTSVTPASGSIGSPLGSPLKPADPRPSSPVKSRFSSASGGGGFQSRTPGESSRTGAANFQASLSTRVQAWKNWDAKKADEELAEKRRREDETAPKVDRSTLVFNEIYRPITLSKDGKRVPASGSCHRVVTRSDIGFDSSNASHSVASGSPAPKSGNGGDLKGGKTLLEIFKLYPSLKTVTSQKPKVDSREAGFTSDITSSTSGLSLSGAQLPELETYLKLPKNDKRSSEASRIIKKLPGAGAYGLTRPGGAGSPRFGCQQQQPTGDLMIWEAPTKSNASTVIIEEYNHSASAADVGDLYGSSPPRSRAQKNTPTAIPISSTTIQGAPATHAVRGATSQQPENSSGNLIDFE